MNGAVQGVESTAAIIPNRKEPVTVSWDGFTRSTQDGRFIEKKPHIPAAMMQIIIPTAMVKAGYWKSLLVALDPEMLVIAIARPIQKAITPTDIAVPRIRHRERLPAARDKPMILIGISGRTHGVKFKSNPPIAAIDS